MPTLRVGEPSPSTLCKGNGHAIYDHAQALTHASLNFSTPIVVVADGSIDPDPNGSAYAANVGVTFGTTAASSLFTISTGVSSTLISIGLAQSLGIPCSGQPLSFTSELGTFAVPSAVVGVNVFAQQAGQTLEVGCLSHALDPDNINILGMDFRPVFQHRPERRRSSCFLRPYQSFINP